MNLFTIPEVKFFGARLLYEHQYRCATMAARPYGNLSQPQASLFETCLILSPFLHFFYSCAEQHVWARRHILFQVAAGLKALPPPGPGRPEDTSQMASDNASAATQLDKVSTPLLCHFKPVCIACLHATQSGLCQALCQRHHAGFKVLIVTQQIGQGSAGHFSSNSAIFLLCISL